MIKRLSILLILLLLPALCACGKGGSIYSNHRKVDRLQVVRALGVDAATGGDIKLSVSTILGEAEEKSATILRAKGPNITRTLEFLQGYSSRDELFIAPMTTVVIGEELARSGIQPFLDHAQRNTQIRLETDMFIVRGDEASSLFSESADINYEISEMLGSLKYEVKHMGLSRVSTIREVSRDLSENGVSLVCAVEPVKLSDVVSSAESDALIARQAGLAIISDGKLVGFLSDSSSRGACFLLGLAADGSALVPDESGLVSLLFSGSSVEMKPVWKENRLEKLSVKISVDSAVIEQSGKLNVDDDETEKRLSRELADYIRVHAQKALDDSKNMGIDFLGIGQKLNALHPIKFASIKNNWENVWKDLDLDLDIDASVKKRYDIGDPQSFDGSEKDCVILETE